ncbi:hypothetical protein [Streptomyces fragilis]|uniref:hypothetical protein n=1 Tax=Streptomyces fragilis TaxID=67301 RepID=UPI0024DE9A9C|nr:hypothetical protein [Streptomyces fragilis]
MEGAVSYTHLDVYKRQALRGGGGTRRREHPVEGAPGQKALRGGGGTRRGTAGRCLLYTSRCV